MTHPNYSEYTYKRKRYIKSQKQSIYAILVTIALTICLILVAYHFYLFNKNNDFVEINAISTKAVNNKNYTCDHSICHMVTVYSVYKVDNVEYPAKITEKFTQWDETQIYLAHYKKPREISILYNTANPRVYIRDGSEIHSPEFAYIVGLTILAISLFFMCWISEVAIKDFIKARTALKDLQIDISSIESQRNISNNPKKKKTERKSRPTYYEMKERDSFTCPICLE